MSLRGADCARLLIRATKRPEEDCFATADLIRAMTVSGTAPELRDRMRHLREAGYDEVVVQITPGCETMIEDWARVFEIV